MLKSFKNRLLIIIVSMMALAQGVTIVLALASIHRSVRVESAHQLSATRAMLDRTLTERMRRLRSVTDVLVRDYGFKEAVATSDQLTIQSVLRNHAARAGADLAVLYGLDGSVVAASTAELLIQARHSLSLPESETTAAPFAVVGGRPFQIVVVPVRAPQIVAWVTVGFALDQSLADQLAKLADTDVSFVFHEPDGTNQIISTLPKAHAEALNSMPQSATTDAPALVSLGGVQYLTQSAPLQTQSGTLELVAQQSQDMAMEQFRSIRFALLMIGGVALASAIVVALLASRSAMRPLGLLVTAAKQIERGYYCDNIQIGGSIEFRRLAGTFNSMQQGIRVREEQILHQATHDSLTGLVNREGLRQQMSELPLDRQFSAAMIDIQRFRDINASVGHQVGDQLLRVLAERFGQFAGNQLPCARVGADQFVVVCALRDSELLHRMMVLGDELRTGIQVGDLRLSIDVRVGVSERQLPRGSAEDWLRQADVALLQAKEHGTMAVVYQPTHDSDHRRRVLLVAELRRALVGEGLSLHYQPLVGMSDRTLVGFEALLRWTHPTLGSISPAEFVPLAERASVLPDLSRFVLNAAITQLGQWRREGIDAEISVNLSAADFADGDLASRILALLNTHRAPASGLLLEVTESVIMREPQLAAQVMQQLRSAGVRFAIDDFGTGHSSLAQLHALPVDELKIDRAFVMNLESSANNVAIVRTTIELGHNLGLKVVAEGIETPEVWATLSRLGCDLAQGYFISRPMAADAVPDWVRQHRDNWQARSSAELPTNIASLRLRKS